jgi:NAD(P)-dependent dehydrogenase (short-subunit alcohol dehydrogenase family)
MNSVLHDPASLRVGITGGTSGLGLALARQFHSRGDRVAIVARNAAAVESVAAMLPGTIGIAADVSRKQDIHAIALQMLGRLGGLDVLINNASTLGPVPLRPLADTECEDVETVFATNLLGPFRLTKALLGALAATAREGRGAAVVNIGSDAAVNAYPDWGAYGASKAALVHMSRIWHAELQSEGVAVIAIDPGELDTPMHAAAMPDADRAALRQPAAAAADIIAQVLALLRAQEPA